MRGKYICPRCGRKFSSERAVKMHMRWSERKVRATLNEEIEEIVKCFFPRIRL